jgi:hypothetical protein
MLQILLRHLAELRIRIRDPGSHALLTPEVVCTVRLDIGFKQNAIHYTLFKAACTSCNAGTDLYGTVPYIGRSGGTAGIYAQQ